MISTKEIDQHWALTETVGGGVGLLEGGDVGGGVGSVSRHESPKVVSSDAANSPPFATC